MKKSTIEFVLQEGVEVDEIKQDKFFLRTFLPGLPQRGE